MALELSEIKKKLQKQSKRATISEAIHHQNRIKFHAQTEIQTAASTQPLTDFLSWVGTLLPADKFKIFKQLFRYPVCTNELTGICFDKLSRVFDGRNPAFNYQFTQTEFKDDWEWYRQDVLHAPTIWPTKGWRMFQTEINSVLVVDMPEVSTSVLPEPYFYFLPIDSVLDYEVGENGIMKYIIFRQDGDRIAVIDDSSYRVYGYKNSQIGELMTEAAHSLGYCPAKFFWSEPISQKNADVKASPLTKELEALDWYLFFNISKRHLDLFGAYPIYSGYEQSCDYSNEDGDYCDGGFLKDKLGSYKHDGNGLMVCPRCGQKRIIGAGSFVEVPIPTGDQPDLRNPVQMLTADVASLDYNVKEVERLKESIINSVIGVDSEIIASQAVNEKQVEANYEAQSTILNRIKKGFEEAQKFVEDTICRLRYGAGFVSSSINYGTDFYTLTATELRARYKIAKENGASQSELDAMHTQIIESEYRTNPLQLQRMLILADLEPMRHLSNDEVMTQFEKGIISREEMRLKLRFSEYIKRFERENSNIIDFGTATSYKQKIDTITKTLKKYASED